MLQQVLAESEAKLEKSAAAGCGVKPAGKPPMKKKVAEDLEDAEKIANACDFLADHLHEVIDDRGPHEKLAELIAIQEALFKTAEDPPMDPPLDSGVNPGGPASAMVTNETNTPGGPPLEGGDSGEATGGHQSPKTTAPTEKPNPADAANAMPTNEDMMMGEQPEDVLKQAQLGQISADEAAEKIAQYWTKEARGVIGALGEAASLKKIRSGLTALKQSKKLEGLERGEQVAAHAKKQLTRGALESGALYGTGAAGIAGGVAAAKGKKKKAALTPEMAANAKKVKAVQDPSKPGAEVPAGLGKKASEDVRERMSMAMLNMFKGAEDAINPAQISGGTEPILQSAAGANPAQMQGTEVGEQTPRETAPTSYQGAGRDLIASNDAAINYSKGQAKGPQKKPLSELLTEPALSSAHDSVLQKSLDSTSEAGVKISSLREMLKKAAAYSPEAKAVIDYRVKVAQGEVPPPGENMPGGEAEAVGETTTPEVSDEAIAAAAEGVTTDELAKAQVMLAAQAAQAGAQEAAPAEPPPAPEQGAEQPAPQEPPAPEQAQA